MVILSGPEPNEDYWNYPKTELKRYRGNVVSSRIVETEQKEQLKTLPILTL
jgi:hypothetical protein